MATVRCGGLRRRERSGARGWRLRRREYRGPLWRRVQKSSLTPREIAGEVKSVWLARGEVALAAVQQGRYRRREGSLASRPGPIAMQPVRLPRREISGTKSARPQCGQVNFDAARNRMRVSAAPVRPGRVDFGVAAGSASTPELARIEFDADTRPGLFAASKIALIFLPQAKHGHDHCSRTATAWLVDGERFMLPRVNSASSDQGYRTTPAP